MSSVDVLISPNLRIVIEDDAIPTEHLSILVDITSKTLYQTPALSTSEHVEVEAFLTAAKTFSE